MRTHKQKAMRQARLIAKRKNKKRAVLTLCKHLKNLINEKPA